VFDGEERETGKRGGDKVGQSTIEWTQATWNPVTGCDKVSPGCAHCYAETFAERWRGVPGNAYEQGFDLRLWPSRLEYPLKWKKPKVIFVNSMSDLFHEQIPEEYIAEVFDVMVRADQHVYQVLTKRHERLAELAPRLPWPEHIWMGVSIENRRFVHRADYLRQVPAAVRFISAEPLLGQLEGLDLTDIHWLIAGGESGHKHRPVKAEWIRDVRDLCQTHGVPFFFKQWGGLRSKSGGRMLDGREWNAMPEHNIDAQPAPTGPKMPKRKPDVPDGADEKWNYPEHTAAKHEILRRYLGAWLAILGRGQGGFRHQQLILLDGFAGRGRYMEGQPGSPAIMFQRAAQVADDDLVENVLVRCSEPDKTNFGHLEEVCKDLVHPKVLVRATQDTFEDVAQRFIAWAKGQNPPPPTFVMVDPYGVKGVHLDTLRKLLKFDRLEILLTFMVRDPARFLEANYDEALTALFGGSAWRECAEAPDRPECLMRKFHEVVTKDAAAYALPYKVHEDEKQTVLYYLVHLTNKDLGMRVMKENMIKKSGDMTFFPITLRPTDQLGLDVAEQPPFPTLQRYLLQKYAGRTLTFVELLNDDYPAGHAWVEPQYKKALKQMETQDQPPVEIRRVKPKTATGKPARTLELRDTLVFSGTVPLL
jgi:three-Cys-motif partner protein